MRNIAFAGDPARKAFLLERVATHGLAGDMTFGLQAWDGAKGTPTGCTVHDADITIYEERTGYPASLGLLLDLVHVHLHGADASGTRARRFALEWLERTPTGADLTDVPSQVVLSALAEEQVDDPGLLASNPAIAAVLRTAIALHGSVVDGTMPVRAAWASARAEALSATDTASGPLAKGLGAIIESVCWNPRTTRSLLVDMARPWAQLRSERAILSSGWTRDDQIEADAALERIWLETAAERERNETVDFQGLFDARHGCLARRFAAQRAVGNQAYPAAMARLADLCLDALSKAPASPATG